MIKYFKYYWFILRHKYYVFIECLRFSHYYIGFTRRAYYTLIWRGIVHDLDKLFLFKRARGYANATFGSGRSTDNGLNKDKFMDLKYEDDPEFFVEFWLHQRNNPHHWLFHVFLSSDKQTFAVPMKVVDILEMICDWVGASKVRGNPKSFLNWYDSNKDKMILHPDSRKKIEALLNLYRS